jgi:hypothetical protein
MPCCDWDLRGAFRPVNQFELFLNWTPHLAECSGGVLVHPILDCFRVLWVGALRRNLVLVDEGHIFSGFPAMLGGDQVVKVLTSLGTDASSGKELQFSSTETTKMNTLQICRMSKKYNDSCGQVFGENIFHSSVTLYRCIVSNQLQID